jgi:excisionase family DNA binding protein
VAERLLTARELANYLGLAPATILDKWERGELPGFKFGRAVRSTSPKFSQPEGRTRGGTRQRTTRVRSAVLYGAPANRRRAR